MLLLVFCIHQKQVTVHSYTKEEMKILSARVKYVGIFSSHYRCIASTGYLLKCTPIVFCTVKLFHHALVYLFPPSDFNCLLLHFSTADVPYDIITGCNFYLFTLRIQIL